MENILKIVGYMIKYLFTLAIILFAISTFMGKSYLQTFILLTMVVALVYWPSILVKIWNKQISMIVRILFIVILFAINIIFFKPAPKTSIYLSDIHKKKLMSVYDKLMTAWPEDTENIYLQTEYGKVHVLACGLKENPPLIMIHAASMGAHSWEVNIEPLIDHYRIYSIDNIGEGNKSELNNTTKYPNTRKEIADFYAELADSLGVIRSPVFGASNGGFIAMSYAYFYPKRVESLSLFCPMGLTKLTTRSIIMLSIASMYPFQFVRNCVFDWAFGNDKYVTNKYWDWFNCILEGTMPSVAMPEPMSVDQKKKMDLPILLFLGTKDQIVGDTKFAEKTARDFPHIQIEILESGHLIAVEHFDFVNKKLSSFLHIE